MDHGPKGRQVSLETVGKMTKVTLIGDAKFWPLDALLHLPGVEAASRCWFASPSLRIRYVSPSSLQYESELPIPIPVLDDEFEWDSARLALLTYGEYLSAQFAAAINLVRSSEPEDGSELLRLVCECSRLLAAKEGMIYDLLWLDTMIPNASARILAQSVSEDWVTSVGTPLATRLWLTLPSSEIYRKRIEPRSLIDSEIDWSVYLDSRAAYSLPIELNHSVSKLPPSVRDVGACLALTTALSERSSQDWSALLGMLSERLSAVEVRNCSSQVSIVYLAEARLHETGRLSGD